MENNHHPFIEQNITPNEGMAVHLNHEDDGSITIFTIGKRESGGKVLRNREMVYTFHPPIIESSVRDDKEDFYTQLSRKAQEVQRRHFRSSERRVDTGTKPDSVSGSS